MFDIRVVEGETLMIGRPNGVLDARIAEEVVEFIEIKELELEKGFDRFCDLSLLEGIQLSFVDVLELAARRSKFNPNSIRVKSAFLAIHAGTHGVASMYQRLLASPRIEVRIFDQLEEAAEWLAVKPERLCPERSNAA
jgi:hypothetical protein